MKNVIIIGGGYGGLRAAEQLSKNKYLRITIVDQNPYHYMQTEAYGFIAGRFDMSEIAVNIQAFADGLSDNVHFVQDKATGIDEVEQMVLLERKGRLSYDYVIVAVGARTNFFSFIKGARENSFGVKHIERALGFRRAFEERLYDKLQDKKFDQIGDLHIAIAGAGLSGVEIAAEMAFVLESVKKILPDQSNDFTITLVDAADTILPGMHPYIIETTQKRLDDLGVVTMTKAFIDHVDPHEITFKGGEKLTFDFMIYTAGVKGNDFVDAFNVEKNRINQIIPDEHLRIPGRENVFIIGDCAQIKDVDGNLLPPTAQVAERCAEYVARCIIQLEKGKALPAFKESVDGVFVSLGGQYGVGIMYDKFKLKGYPAYLFKKLITRFYRLGLEFKVNSAFKNRQVSA